MNEQFLQYRIIELINSFGDLGVFLGMFLESSIVPIPSEIIIMGAGAIGISISSILIFGSLGATLGAALGYSIGRFAAMPVILKMGKYIFIKPHHINKAEEFAKKYGVVSVFFARLLPVVPFKVFSIASGIIKVPFIPFLIYTFFGVVPRIYILAFFGSEIPKYKREFLFLVGLAIIVFVVFKIIKAVCKARQAQKEQ